MSKGLEIVPSKDKTKLEIRQSPTPSSTSHTPQAPCAGGKFLREKYYYSQYDLKQAYV